MMAINEAASYERHVEPVKVRSRPSSRPTSRPGTGGNSRPGTGGVRPKTPGLQLAESEDSGLDSEAEVPLKRADGTIVARRDTLSTPWREKFDKKTNRPFYLNVETNTKQWNRPPELDSLANARTAAADILNLERALQTVVDDAQSRLVPPGGDPLSAGLGASLSDALTLPNWRALNLQPPSEAADVLTVDSRPIAWLLAQITHRLESVQAELEAPVWLSDVNARVEEMQSRIADHDHGLKALTDVVAQLFAVTSAGVNWGAAAAAAAEGGTTAAAAAVAAGMDPLTAHRMEKSEHSLSEMKKKGFGPGSHDDAAGDDGGSGKSGKSGGLADPAMFRQIQALKAQVAKLSGLVAQATGPREIELLQEALAGRTSKLKAHLIEAQAAMERKFDFKQLEQLERFEAWQGSIMETTGGRAQQLEHRLRDTDRELEEHQQLVRRELAALAAAGERARRETTEEFSSLTAQLLHMQVLLHKGAERDDLAQAEAKRFAASLQRMEESVGVLGGASTEASDRVETELKKAQEQIARLVERAKDHDDQLHQNAAKQ